MTAPVAAEPRVALGRAAGLLGLWMVLIGTDPIDTAVGAITAAAAAWVSLRLLPQPTRLRPAALPRLALRFLRQSIRAGLDVARRVFDPRLPLSPGYATYPVGFPPGTSRAAFTGLTSLLPGSVPSGDDAGGVVYHCLDVDQPVLAQLAEEEAALRQALRQRR